MLWSLLAGLFALNFTFTVFIVALPTVATQFHTSVTVLTWTMVGPLLAYGLAAPVLGKTGDVYGHRRLYLFGLIGAMVSAILTALAHNVDMLLFARTLDGVQGAATGTASGALITWSSRAKSGSRPWAGGVSSARGTRNWRLAGFADHRGVWVASVVLVPVGSHRHRVPRGHHRPAATTGVSTTKKPKRKPRRVANSSNLTGWAVARSRWV